MTDFECLEWLYGQGKFALDFLIYNEFMVQQTIGEGDSDSPNSQISAEYRFELTQKGMGVFESGLSPEDSVLLYEDLLKA
jgi:hypothetical protein